MTARRERARWKIAYALNHVPGMCWSSLVSWVLYGDPDYRIRDCRVGWMCESDRARNGSCYCGNIGSEAERIAKWESRSEPLAGNP